MRGRITEEHLELAELTFPGITEMYTALPDKPSTFLQLVWLYEDVVAALNESRGANRSTLC